jgi:hypothetical protein
LEVVMPLLAPEVKGPVSVCNKKVRIKGHIAGATVKVFVNGAETASKVSNWPDDVFDVGATLNAGDRVTAVQEFDGETSPQSLPAVVQSAPSSLANLTTLTHLHRCGTALWAEGATPGAEVKALINKNVVGLASSIDGIARIKYSPGLNSGQSLTLEQNTCNKLSNNTGSPSADPLPNPLPLPKIAGPLIECMTAIKISNVTDGATVTIYRDGIKDVSDAFDRPSLTWIGLQPLEEGELIEVDQSFMCRERIGRGRERRGRGDEGTPTHISGKASAKVESAASITKPKILGPVCPDAKLITVSNLIPSARVILYQNGKAIGMTDAPDVTYSFSAPPLDPDAPITARMQLCDKDGPLSDPVHLQKDEPVQLVTTAALYACASHIHIRGWGLTYGKIVFARNSTGDVISAYHHVHTHEYLFPVAPALVAGDEITIVVLGCGDLVEEFGPFKVEPAPEPPMPVPAIQGPVTENSFFVNVLSDHAGALVKVYVDGVFSGQAVSRGDKKAITLVWLKQPLKLKQSVTATQSLCDMVSRPSEPAIVVVPPPHVPQLIQPANKASGVSAMPVTFKWSDLGAKTSAAATKFSLKVYEDNSLVVSPPSSSNEAAVNLSYNTHYTWRVDAYNSTGVTVSPVLEFKTKKDPAEAAEPADPAPENAILTFVTELYASYDGGVNQVQHPTPNKAFHMCVVVANISNATSDAFKIVFEWKGEGQSGSETINAPAFPPNWSELAWMSFPNGLSAGQYEFYVDIVVNNTSVAKNYHGLWFGF